MYASVCVRSLKRDREKEIIWVFYRERERRWEIWGLLWVSLCLSAFKRVCKRERQRQRMRSCDRDRERERENARLEKGSPKVTQRYSLQRTLHSLSQTLSQVLTHTHTLSLSHSKTLACAFVVLWEMRIKMRANFSSLCSEQLRVQTEATKIETIFRHLKRIFYDNFVKVTLTVWWKGEL